MDRMSTLFKVSFAYLRRMGLILLLSLPALFAQQSQKKAFEQQSPSTITYKSEDGSETVEIKNVVFELVGPGIPGRPLNERVVLRKTTRTKQVVDEIGQDGTTTVDAWPLGVD